MTDTDGDDSRARPLPPQQHVLPMEYPRQASFDDFVVGENIELVAALTKQGAEPAAQFQGLWLSGERKSGRSHLLQAACLAAQERGQIAVYIACAKFNSISAQLLGALDQAERQADLVALDDIGHLIQLATLDMQLGSEIEPRLVSIYQRLSVQRSEQPSMPVGMPAGRLLVSHTDTAQTISCQTPDLASRLQSLMHYRVSPLGDSDKSKLLVARARHRGYRLDQAVLTYWLRRGPRALGNLLEDLDRLDDAALARHAQITVPLLKQVLGY